MAPRKADASPRHGGNAGAAPKPAPGDGNRTKSDLARQHIEELILSGTVRAGDRITTREVSLALMISETPVREAIRGLAAEGWLSLQAHHGGVVASINTEHLTEVYAIRGALGAVAVELGGPDYTPRLLAALDSNLEQAKAAVKAGDVPQYARLNREFHLLLCDTPNTQWTLRLLTNLSAQTMAARRGFEAVPARIRGSFEEHQAIRQAIDDRNFAHAATLLVEHERVAGAILIAALTNPTQGGVAR